ncbi:hypothetical protein BDF21DRAFT_429353, partial [Thamnidium elegans]
MYTSPLYRTPYFLLTTATHIHVSIICIYFLFVCKSCRIFQHFIFLLQNCFICIYTSTNIYIYIYICVCVCVREGM